MFDGVTDRVLHAVHYGTRNACLVYALSVKSIYSFELLQLYQYITYVFDGVTDRVLHAVHSGTYYALLFVLYGVRLGSFLTIIMEHQILSSIL